MSTFTLPYPEYDIAHLLQETFQKMNGFSASYIPSTLFRLISSETLLTPLPRACAIHLKLFPFLKNLSILLRSAKSK